MIGQLLTGVPLIDALVLWGIVFAALLFPGIPLWMVGSKLKWRRKDAQEMARLLDRITPTDAPKHAAEVAK